MAEALAASTGQIEIAQRDLDGLAYGAGEVDGIVGPKTAHAIGRFQRNWDLSVTDRLNSSTYHRLTTRVRVVQEHVDVTADGIYGPATSAAVRSFQRHAGFTADGICGPVTHRALGIAYTA